jgi:hypothetical protein
MQDLEPHYCVLELQAEDSNCQSSKGATQRGADKDAASLSRKWLVTVKTLEICRGHHVYQDYKSSKLSAMVQSLKDKTLHELTGFTSPGIGMDASSTAVGGGIC